MTSSQCRDPSQTESLLAIIGRLHSGDRERARVDFAAMWQRLPTDDWFHRCVLSHYMADAQDDVHVELEWDARALAAAEAAEPCDFEGRFPGMTLASFLPSLHLNVASCLERLGRYEEACAQAIRADSMTGGIGVGPLEQLTRDAIARMLVRLGAPVTLDHPPRRSPAE